MAKILRIRIGRDEASGRTHYEYPPEYDAKKIQVMVYESMLPANRQAVRDRGNTDEYLIGVVSDADAPDFLISDDIEEIDYAVAVNLGNQWTEQILKVSDKEAIASICEKIAQANPNQKINAILTQEELDAINPDNPTEGVVRSMSFQEWLDNLLQRLG